MTELALLVTLALMATSDVLLSLARSSEAEADRLAEERRLLREKREAARDEDERRRVGRVKSAIGYRA